MQKAVAVMVMMVLRRIARYTSVTTLGVIMLPQVAVTIVVNTSVQKAVVTMRSHTLHHIVRHTVARTQVVII